jgi:hypothetical protein
MNIRDGIILIEGNTPQNLMQKPIVSNAYFLRDGDDVVLFDPSCGKEIANDIADCIRQERREKKEWRKAVVIAGHSHLDHANNFYLSDVIKASDTHIYVHEKGFNNGAVKNEPIEFFQNMFTESKKYYNIYRSFFGPFALLSYPIVLLDKIAPKSAAKMMCKAGARTWPKPVNGSTKPEPLREADLQIINIGPLTQKVGNWAT